LNRVRWPTSDAAVDWRRGVMSGPVGDPAEVIGCDRDGRGWVVCRVRRMCGCGVRPALAGALGDGGRRGLGGEGGTRAGSPAGRRGCRRRRAGSVAGYVGSPPGRSRCGCSSLGRPCDQGVCGVAGAPLMVKPMPPASEVDTLVDRFAGYLQQERGLRHRRRPRVCCGRGVCRLTPAAQS
jgi:hypothetical protein